MYTKYIQLCNLVEFCHFLVMKRQAPNGFLGFSGINVMNDIFLRVYQVI
jgi:hypothetical protein